ncbi:MAG: hypothetical protein ACREJ2_07235 [Planctomycetota bacterium]
MFDADRPENAPAARKLTALSVSDVVTFLRRSGSQKVSEEAVQHDIAAGAPVNADGTINLVHYAAWLAREVSRGA